MKKTVLTFGLISGSIMGLLMIITAFVGKNIGFDKGEIIGYSTMILASIMLFIGVKSYRDNANGGTISFGKGFKVALLITLVSTLIYVAVWMVLSYTIMSDFFDQYTAAMAEKVKASGLTPEQLAAKKAELDMYKEMYKNPIWRAAFTFIEPLPVGIPMSLIAALVLKKKQK